MSSGAPVALDASESLRVRLRIGLSAGPSGGRGRLSSRDFALGSSRDFALFFLDFGVTRCLGCAFPFEQFLALPTPPLVPLARYFRGEVAIAESERERHG